MHSLTTFIIKLHNINNIITSSIVNHTGKALSVLHKFLMIRFMKTLFQQMFATLHAFNFLLLYMGL